jgi:hypothetical protein
VIAANCVEIRKGQNQGKKRMKLQDLTRKINHARIRLGCKLPLIQSQDVLEGHEDVAVQVPFVSTHWETASLFDHMFIGSLARTLQPRVVFEIGTSLGLVTSTLGTNTPQSTIIHTLDLSNDPRIGSFFRARPEGSKIRQHFGPSTEYDFSSMRGAVDLMFIDGSHEFADVVKDSRNAFECLSERGVVLWHDVTPYFPGVVRALESLPEASKIFRIYGTGFAMLAKPASGLTLGVPRSTKSDQLTERAAEVVVA